MNKVSTKVEMRFNVEEALWLEPEVRLLHVNERATGWQVIKAQLTLPIPPACLYVLDHRMQVRLRLLEQQKGR